MWSSRYFRRVEKLSDSRKTLCGWRELAMGYLARRWRRYILDQAEAFARLDYARLAGRVPSYLQTDVVRVLECSVVTSTCHSMHSRFTSWSICGSWSTVM